MNAMRYHLALGLACTLPVVTWTLLQDPAPMATGAWSQTTRGALKALWISLAMGGALFLPWHAQHWAWRDSLLDTLLGTLLLVLVGLPFLALVWQSGGAPASALAQGLAGLWAFALLASLLGRGLAGLRLGTETRDIGRAALQVLLGAVVWITVPLWLPWTGL